MAIKSFGVEITVATNSIGGLRDLTIPATEMTDIDVTTHDSASGYKEFIGGLKDGGTVELSGVYLIADVGQIYLRTPANQTGTPVACVVTFSDASSATFNAYIKGYGTSAPLDDTVPFTASLKISGPVTYAAGV